MFDPSHQPSQAVPAVPGGLLAERARTGGRAVAGCAWTRSNGREGTQRTQRCSGARANRAWGAQAGDNDAYGFGRRSVGPADRASLNSDHGHSERAGLSWAIHGQPGELEGLPSVAAQEPVEGRPGRRRFTVRTGGTLAGRAARTASICSSGSGGPCRYGRSSTLMVGLSA